MATYELLRAELPVSTRTLQRHLKQLVATGELQRLSRGRYSRSSVASISGQAAELVGLIDESGAEAHVTGFDPLAGYAHQFTYQYPHLIYCHPSHVSGLVEELRNASWFVTSAGPHAMTGSAPERTVVIRGQPLVGRRALVRGMVALPEKAWVDLLRETRRSRMPFDYGELGRILRNMERGGRDVDLLLLYARRAGYRQWVNAALGRTPPASPEEQQLFHGYHA